MAKSFALRGSGVASMVGLAKGVVGGVCVSVFRPLCALTLQLAAVLSAANIYSGH